MKINVKCRLFCRLYATSGECFGNGALSYSVAYNRTNKTAKQIASNSQMASMLLKNLEVYSLCEKFLAETMDDAIADKELSRVILQSHDLKAKVAAIRAYNDVRGRNQTRVKVGFEGVSDEELKERAAKIIAGILSDQGGNGDEGEGGQSEDLHP